MTIIDNPRGSSAAPPAGPQEIAADIIARLANRWDSRMRRTPVNLVAMARCSRKRRGLAASTCVPPEVASARVDTLAEAASHRCRPRFRHAAAATFGIRCDGGSTRRWLHDRPLGPPGSQVTLSVSGSTVHPIPAAPHWLTDGPLAEHPRHS